MDQYDVKFNLEAEMRRGERFLEGIKERLEPKFGFFINLERGYFLQETKTFQKYTDKTPREGTIDNKFTEIYGECLMKTFQTV